MLWSQWSLEDHNIVWWCFYPKMWIVLVDIVIDPSLPRGFKVKFWKQKFRWVVLSYRRHHCLFKFVTIETKWSFVSRTNALLDININRLSQLEYRYYSVHINLNVFETAFLNINYTHPDLFLFFPGSCLFYPFSPCVLFCPLSCGGHLNKIRAKFGSVTFLINTLLCKRRHRINYFVFVFIFIYLTHDYNN